MYFRRVIFVVDGNDLCSFVGPVPPEGRRITIENAVLGGARHFTVAGVREVYADNKAHTSVTSMMFSGGPFGVIPETAYVYLTPAAGD